MDASPVVDIVRIQRTGRIEFIPYIGRLIVRAGIAHGPERGAQVLSQVPFRILRFSHSHLAKIAEDIRNRLVDGSVIVLVQAREDGGLCNAVNRLMGQHIQASAEAHFLAVGKGLPSSLQASDVAGVLHGFSGDQAKVIQQQHRGSLSVRAGPSRPGQVVPDLDNPVVCHHIGRIPSAVLRGSQQAVRLSLQHHLLKITQNDLPFPVSQDPKAVFRILHHRHRYFHRFSGICDSFTGPLSRDHPVKIRHLRRLRFHQHLAQQVVFHAQALVRFLRESQGTDHSIHVSFRVPDNFQHPAENRFTVANLAETVNSRVPDIQARVQFQLHVLLPAQQRDQSPGCLRRFLCCTCLQQSPEGADHVDNIVLPENPGTGSRQFFLRNRVFQSGPPGGFRHLFRGLSLRFPGPQRFRSGHGKADSIPLRLCAGPSGQSNRQRQCQQYADEFFEHSEFLTFHTGIFSIFR